MALSESTRRALTTLPLLSRVEAVEELLVGEIMEALRRVMPLGDAQDRAERALVSAGRGAAAIGESGASPAMTDAAAAHGVGAADETDPLVLMRRADEGATRQERQAARDELYAWLATPAGLKWDDDGFDAYAAALHAAAQEIAARTRVLARERLTPLRGDGGRHCYRSEAGDRQILEAALFLLGGNR